MNDMMIFNNPEFGEIRSIEENGKVLFCGSDVAKALGYAKPQNAIDRHCKGALKRGIPHPQSKDKTIEMLFIHEGDIYRLAAKSELPGAERFESWIFDEVLPSIRKHGAYMTPETLEAAILNPDTMIKLCTALKDEQDKRKALEEEKRALMAENEAQRQAIAEFEPMKQYVDTILSSTGTMTTTQIAADYDMSAQKLNRILHEEGLQRKVNGQWILYRRHMGKGYTKSNTFYFNHSGGKPDAKITTQWTQKGRLVIHEMLTKRGIVAIMDREMVS